MASSEDSGERVQSKRTSPTIQFQAKAFSWKLKSRWSGPYIVVAVTHFGAITLKTNSRDEFKVNG